MINKSKVKLIHSLARKKERTEHGLFVAEGPKLVGELLAAGWKPVLLAATEAWLQENPKASRSVAEWQTVTEDELQKCSLQKTPQHVLALFPTPCNETPMGEVAKRELCLCLDGVQDPGNVGTIVRLADWFGINHIYCSMDTADIFGPKAIQASMGAIAHVHVHYTNIVDALKECQAPVYGTHLDGENIYTKNLSGNGVIVMGNEGKGISPMVEATVSERLYIPSFPPEREKVESLNVAIATAVVCAEFRRTNR